MAVLKIAVLLPLVLASGVGAHLSPCSFEEFKALFYREMVARGTWKAQGGRMRRLEEELYGLQDKLASISPLGEEDRRIISPAIRGEYDAGLKREDALEKTLTRLEAQAYDALSPSLDREDFIRGLESPPLNQALAGIVEEATRRAPPETASFRGIENIQGRIHLLDGPFQRRMLTAYRALGRGIFTEFDYAHVMETIHPSYDLIKFLFVGALERVTNGRVPSFRFRSSPGPTGWDVFVLLSDFHPEGMAQLRRGFKIFGPNKGFVALEFWGEIGEIKVTEIDPSGRELASVRSLLNHAHLAGIVSKTRLSAYDMRGRFSYQYLLPPPPVP